MSIVNKFDNLDIALYHLNFIGNSIENAFSAFASIIGKIDEKHERAIYVSTSSIILIQTIAFLDEYHNFIKSNDNELNNTINKIKKAVKPAIDQINEWKELTDFRNHVLAHNLRNRKKMMVTVFEKGLSAYDIPQTGNELLILYNCILMVKKSFESAFKNRLQLVQNVLDQTIRTPKKNKFKNSSEAIAAIDRITKEINTSILKLKRSIV